MRKAAFSVVLLGSLVFAAWVVHSFAKPPRPQLAKTSSPVLVELFTSEGCSSCPPADKLLGELDRDKTMDGIPVVVLSEHVDYWDGLGWKDRFSSRAYTDRQKGYARTLRIDSPYTPQMVVDGRYEFVGNDAESLRQSVHRASASAKAAHVSLTWAAQNRLQVSVTDAPSPNAIVVLAITESGLSTTVDAGENGGRVLRHSGVVRAFRNLGSAHGGRFDLVIPLETDPAWDRKKMTAVVFVQDGSNGPVLGAVSRPFE